MIVAVAAYEHPDLDDWVRERAADEAQRSGAVLGEYLGREDVLGDSRPADLRCHVFMAAYEHASE